MSTDLGDDLDLAFRTAGRCDCGFEPEGIDPADAARTLSTFPQRWRSALAVHLDERDPEVALTGRHTPTAWSALEHAGHVRDVLHALDIRLQRVLREDEPVLPETHRTPPSGANEQGMAVVLAALGVSVDQLARTVQMTSPASWARTAVRSGRTVSALDLAREAVHEGTHHLKEACVAIESLRSIAASAAS